MAGASDLSATLGVVGARIIRGGQIGLSKLSSNGASGPIETSTRPHPSSKDATAEPLGIIGWSRDRSGHCGADSPPGLFVRTHLRIDC